MVWGVKGVTRPGTVLAEIYAAFLTPVEAGGAATRTPCNGRACPICIRAFMIYIPVVCDTVQIQTSLAGAVLEPLIAI